MQKFLIALTLVLGALGASAQTIDTSEGPVRVEAALRGLDAPWGSAFCPMAGY